MLKFFLFLIFLIILLAGAYFLIPDDVKNNIELTIQDFTNLKTVDSSPTLDDANLQPLKTGGFTSAFVGHSASGTAKLFRYGGKYFVKFENDFKITQGPSLTVYLGDENNYDPNAKIAPLKSTSGAQVYEVLGNIDPLKYKAVWVYSDSYNVPFGTAVFK